MVSQSGVKQGAREEQSGVLAPKEGTDLGPGERPRGGGKPEGGREGAVRPKDKRGRTLGGKSGQLIGMQGTEEVA